MSNQNKSTALSADLNSFIYGVSRRNFQNAPELTKIGIGLLKNFPAARDAVLEYFAMVFHDAVNISLNQDYEQDSSNNGSLESVGMIGPELCNMGESWAPFIAPWCINLIMDIATEKANLPNATLQNTDPIRVLLDITTQNLTLLNSEERAKCIDMMLGCRACSWAVGWVGRAEPALVAPRALALAPDAARAVLAHLANHPPALYHVRAALVDLFQEAIREDGNPEKKREVIPYLLNLASKSDIVLKALTQDIENTLTDAVVSRLQAVSPRGEGAGAGALVALLLRCDARCYLLLLHHAQWNTFCRHLLEQLLQKLEYESLFPESNIPLLTSAAEEINILREKLLVGNKLEQYSITRILILVSYNFPSEFVSTISYLLQHSRSDGTLALLVRLLGGTSSMHTPNDDLPDTDRYQNFIKTGVEYALRDAMIADTQVKKCFIEGNIVQDQKTYLHHLCLNIVTLLRWENSGRVSVLRSRSVSRAVEASVYRVGAALRERACDLRARPRDTAAALPDMPTCHALAQVLDRIDLTGTKSPPPSVEAILKIVQATVKYFFRCLFEEDIMRKIIGVQTACGLLRKVCAHSKVARGAALRELLDAALFRYDQVFASTTTTQQSPGEELLLYMNRKHGPITQLTQSHTSVFHAGVLGRGARRGAAGAAPAPRILAPDNELLMGAIMSCMDGNSGIVEGATSVSLLLVELISPDVMYNGLPWPDEDFTKQVSIERELYMRCAVERCGVARAALRRAARARPALCLAAALLRAAAASLLHRLRAHLDRHTHSTEMSRELAALTELLTLMTLGQLLPHPLNHMLEMAPELTASETVQVLRDCLWNYTRDHVPSPALFSCDSTEAPGNAGMKDQVAALRWVKNNIEMFGGDPNNVTIFGESAGVSSVTYHMFSPMSRGLFHKVISQSGVCISDWAIADGAKARAFRAGKILGTETNDVYELYTYFMGLDPNLLTNLTFSTHTDDEKYRGVAEQFVPVVEKKFQNVESFITEDPVKMLVEGKVHRVPLMVGYNSAEGLLMIHDQVPRLDVYNIQPSFYVQREVANKVPADKLRKFGERIKRFYVGNNNITENDLGVIADMKTDMHFSYNIHRFTNLYASLSKSVYMYRFNFVTDLNYVKKILELSDLKGATHGDDIFYVFYNELSEKIYENQPKLREITYKVTKLLTDFAKTGNPTPDNEVGENWKPYTIHGKEYYNIDDTFSAGHYADRERIQFWDEIYAEAELPHISAHRRN